MLVHDCRRRVCFSFFFFFSSRRRHTRSLCDWSSDVCSSDLLGYLPRIPVTHTSESERGQIYIGHVNWTMLILVVLLVLEFKSSSAIASAYGVAVSGTIVLTTLLIGAIVLHSRSRARMFLLAAIA